MADRTGLLDRAEFEKIKTRLSYLKGQLCFLDSSNSFENEALFFVENEIKGIINLLTDCYKKARRCETGFRVVKSGGFNG